ncbi:DNA cytosine methyltransferase [Georgenia yuyongxinii]
MTTIIQAPLFTDEGPPGKASTGRDSDRRAACRPPRTSQVKLTSMSAPGSRLPGVDSFRFVDLFAGIGGFHAVLSNMGGTCVFASEIDPKAASVYAQNWRMDVAGDIIPLTERRMAVPDHDVLAAGFPCQPFSKSGFQRGMDETRGTLFWNIARVLEERKPAVILLENVRNLAGPRHRETWKTIIATLRQLGYKVSSVPTVFSPHLLPPELGGTPQVRERVFITGTYVGEERAQAETEDVPVVPNKPVARADGTAWDPQMWDLETDLPLQDDSEISNISHYRLTAEEQRWINVWEDFVQTLRPHLPGGKLPGFPIWADAFVSTPDITTETPAWKADFLRKNSALYTAHAEIIDAWFARHGDLTDMPPSRRKFEWQAQDATSLWDTIMHFRPSGIRAKKATYVPALVAITQTTILGSRRRRLTPRETARLQGLADDFTFGNQGDAASYKQMGNGVNVGAASYVLREHLRLHEDDVAQALSRAQACDSDSEDSTELAKELVSI